MKQKNIVFIGLFSLLAVVFQAGYAQTVTIGVQNVSVGCSVCIDFVLSTTAANFGCSSWVIDLTYDSAAISSPLVTVNPAFNDGINYTTIVNTTSNQRLLLSNVLNPPIAPFQINSTPIWLATACFTVNNATANPNFSIVNTETYIADQSFATLLSSANVVQPNNFPTNLSSTPIVPTVTTTTANTAALQWATVAGATDYQLRYKLSSESAWSSLYLGSNATNATINGLTPCSNYETQIQAICFNGNTNGYGASALFTTLTPANWTIPPSLQTCDAAINLNNLITGTLGGTWSGIGVSGNTFTPSGLTPNSYNISYTVGSGNCLNTQSNAITVLAAPSAQWTIPTGITNCSNAAAINLNTLVIGTTGGTWSGIGVSGSQFSGVGLISGNYALNYAVGTGNCATNQAQNIAVTPCIPAGQALKCHLWLQGAYLQASNTMRSTLRNNNLLPLKQPYNQAPWYYAGEDSVINAAQLPATMVDWVLIELYHPNTNDIIARKVGCLLADGTVGDVWGNSELYFNVPAGDYRLIARHRNHLAVASTTVVAIPNATPYDFSVAAQILGGTAQIAQLNPANNQLYGLIGGDIDANGVINVNDFNIFAAQTAGMNQYLRSDINLDGSNSITDFNLFQQNAGRIGVTLTRY